MRRGTIASTASVLALTGGLFAVSTGVSQAAAFNVEESADSLDPGSLRAAVIAANANAEADVINLTPGTTYTLSIAGADDTAAAGDLDVTSAITINGNGATVNANEIDRAFHVLPGGSLTLNNVNITNGLADDGGELGNSGGGILTQGVLVVNGGSIRNSDAARAGGAIEANRGPGVEGPAPTTTISAATLAANTAGPTPGNGGAFHITGPGTTTIAGSSITGNSATNEGGGVWNSSAGTMTITDTDISNNEVTVGATLFNGGGGVFQQGGGTNDAPAAATGSIAIDGGSITGNTATGSDPSSGGGVLNIRGDVTITGTTISGNDASRAGGGIEANGNAVDPANTTLIGVLLTDNTTGASPGNGGGFHLTGPGQTNVVDSTVTDNVAANEGGGLWNSAVGEMTVTGTLLAGNIANGDGNDGADDEGGGGLFNDGGTLDVFDSTVSGNAAPNGAGGGVLDVNGTITLIGVTVTDNTSPTGAGVFGFESPQVDTVVFGNSIIAGNNGDDCGGSLESLGGNVLGEGCDDVASDTVVDDPQLGGLADNGGPTLTHLPAQGSPAIDSGLEALCSDVDQRGTARPIDGDGNGSAICDAGAVEAAFIAIPANPGTPPAAPRADAVTAEPTFTG